MKVCLPVLIFALMLSFIPHSASAQVFSLFEPLIKTNAEGDSLQYRLASPERKLIGEARAPLLVFLHGAGERGDDNRRQLVHVMEDFIRREVRYKYPAYLLAPQCPAGKWWSSGEYDRTNFRMAYNPETTTEQELIMEVVQELIASEKVDPDRVYVSGLSMGGAGTWDLLAHYPESFAAAVPICGPTSAEFAQHIPDIPTWVFHGADDSVVPVEQSREIVEALRQGGKRVIYTEFEGVDHNSWDFVFSEGMYVLDWLFSQVRD